MRFRRLDPVAKLRTGDILPMLFDDADPLGTADMAAHHLPLKRGPEAYAMFQKKQDGCVKVVLHP